MKSRVKDHSCHLHGMECCLVTMLNPLAKEFQVQQDLENGVAGAVCIPYDAAGKMEIIMSLVTNVEAMIKTDCKITALKELQLFRNELLQASRCTYTEVAAELHRDFCLVAQNMKSFENISLDFSMQQ
uniref:Uncharacterized protein n=1 Tax=Solanum lycopersicum TaxID=4081 RepID=A0A3Q7HER1_SOLLC